MSTTRRIRGENRFYNPPPMRKLQQEREEREKKRLEEEEEEKRMKELLDRSDSEKEMKRPVSAAESFEECSTSDCSVPGRVSTDTSSNLGRFLECTTPVVSTQHLPLRSIKGWRTRAPEYCPYFLLNDLWDSFEEWSAYGVGVPLLLNGSDSVVQYYVPYLSGIQLYEDPSRARTCRKRAGEESDGDSARGMSSDGSTADCRDISQNLYSMSLEDRTSIGSSSDESEIGSTSPGDLVFEYLEGAMPFGREPLADKILNLSSQFPALRTYRSCDLSPSSWVSVAWYPIYRIPVGQTLQNLDACFLTFHSLSTPSQGHDDGQNSSKSVATSKIPLPTFGLASYKFKLSVWSPENGSGEADEKERTSTLLQAAEEWLKRLKVILPDFRHFISHNGTQWR